MIHRTDRTAAVLLIVLAIAHAGGCSSTTRGEKMVESFARTRDTVTKAQGQVDMTLVSLHALRSTRMELLKDAFRRYKDAVDELEKQGADAKRLAESMEEKADAHVKAWEKEMKTLKDQAVKASMESRRQAVRSNFDLVKMYAQDARKAYDPFLAGNTEIIQALSIDLSPAAISSLSPSIDRVLLDGKALKEKLAAMQLALNNIATGTSPLGEMK
jgi:hypothetical protein